MCGPTTPAKTDGPAARGIPRIGDKAPNFTAQTTHGEINFHDWQGADWVVFFSHPADFTPVCSTELTEIGRRFKEFQQRKVKCIGVSIDSIHSHLAWVQNLEKILDVHLPFPLVADPQAAVAQQWGMIHPGESSTVTVRALFVIDPKHTIRAVIYYPLNVGRNVDEIVRLVDALQTADTKGVACPVNWTPGQKVIVPPPKSEKEVAERLAADYERLDFYLCKKDLK